MQIGSPAGPETAVPASLLRSRRIRITGAGAGTASTAMVRAELPGYIQLIAGGRVDVPVRTFPLADEIGQAWRASSASGNRVVITP